MKKFTPFLFGGVLILLSSCWHNDHNVNIHYKDAEDYYSMKAYFSRNSTRRVERYMDDRIGRRSHMSFVNSRIDGTIGLDDHTTFYIKKYPGYLEIKLDKYQNSPGSYETVKSMCQGIRNVLTN